MDEARVQEIAVCSGALKNWLNLLVEDVFVVLKGGFPLLGAFRWHARLPIGPVQNDCVILRVKHEYWRLDISIYVLYEGVGVERGRGGGREGGGGCIQWLVPMEKKKTCLLEVLDM